MVHQLLELQADYRKEAIPALITQTQYDKIKRLAKEQRIFPSKVVEKLIEEALADKMSIN